MKRSKIWVGGMIPLALGGQLAVAGELDQNSVTRLDTVVITATRSEESIGSIAGKMQVIERDDLMRQLQSGDNLSTALGRLIPNFGVETQTATGGTQTIRGRKPLYLIDGVPQSDNRNVSRFLNSVSPLMVERVEVVTGASAIYGVGGTGGVINIITRSAGEDEGVNFSTQVGTAFSTQELDSDSFAYTIGQTIAFKEGDFDGFIGLEYEETNGFYDADGDRIAPEPAQTSTHDSDRYSTLAKLAWQLDSDKRLQFSYDYVKNEQDSDYAPNYGGPGAPALTGTPVEVKSIKGLNLHDQPKTEREAFSLQYTDNAFLGQQLSALAYKREREYRFFPFAFSFGPQNFVNQSTSEADVYGGKLVLSADVNDVVSVVYGADYQKDKGEQNAVGYDASQFLTSGGLDYVEIDAYGYGPDVDTKTFGGFADFKFQLTEALLFRAGMRYEDIEQEVDDFMPTYEHLLVPDGLRVAIQGDTHNYNETLFNAGLVYSLNDSQQIFANYSEGFEIPDLARLLRNAVAPTSMLAGMLGVPGTVISDMDLEAMKVDSYELGWRGDWEPLTASLTAFYNESDKTTTFNADYSVSQKDQKKKIYGLEGSLDYFLDRYWAAGISGAYTRGKTKDEQSGKWLHLDALEVAPAKVVSYLAYDLDSGSSIRLQATSVFDYNKAEDSTSSGAIVDDGDIDGYTTLDLLTRWKLPLGELGVSITNLTNRDYQTVYSQWAEHTYGQLSGVQAKGRMLGASYRIDY
ncbi:TonB-dependent receptor [Aestuariirhabdus sp. Z084]|uniref:TonB-dependent receptor n=1 Tax=Aestuariirhabdus haliotis TaxID=2918751 RepID=UPI00201B3998|nr:TonB-dependent receptor [Aestuariirhabdus haliotis]MCL6415479.1 TonB-dependent receptor [Aestuariirhabdus haliotis]MCL6419316.1 TonB-dependent receptor [Aestuariirhabdus haliotis]